MVIYKVGQDTQRRLHDTSNRTQTDMDQQTTWQKREGYQIGLYIQTHFAFASMSPPIHLVTMQE